METGSSAGLAVRFPNILPKRLHSEDQAATAFSPYESTVNRDRESGVLFARDLLDHAYSLLPIALFASVLLALVLIVVFWRAVPHYSLLAWAGAVLGISAARYALCRSYFGTSANLKEHHWKKLFMAGLVLSGIVWGSTGIILFAEGSPAHQIFLAFVLGGIVAGATTSLAAFPSAHGLFALLALTPTIARFLHMGGDVPVAMGIMLMVYVFMSMILSSHVHKMLLTSLRLRVENRAEIAERRRTEEELRKQQDMLEETVLERTADLTEANRTLYSEIREREQAEEKVRQSEARFRRIFEASTVAIWEMDYSDARKEVEGLKAGGFPDISRFFENNNEFVMQVLDKVKIVDVNLAGIKLHRARSRDELLASFREIFTPDAVSTLRQLLVSMVEGGRFFERETTFNTLDGGQIDALLSVSIPSGDSGYDRLLVYVTDITEYKKLQRDLNNARNIESLGLLAGGIAHDFNNLLTAVFGYIELARKKLPPGQKSHDYLERAHSAMDNARNLTQQLLTFSKGGSPVKKVSSVYGLIRDTSLFVLSGSSARCELDIPKDLWPVDIDRGQMAQVFQNLLINAKEAMVSGGMISIKGENYMQRYSGDFPLPEGRFVRISVSDTGPGIDEDILPMIFDPYFTTKSRGEQKGTGLGLAVCQSVLKKHEGHIFAESKIGSGATFNLFIPAKDGQIEEEAAARPGLGPKPISTGRGGYVLLMEDEVIVSDVCVDMLNHLGYSAVAVRDGNAAVEEYKRASEAGRPFDAVILDLTVKGGVGGEETLRRLLKIDPGVKAIVASGYSDAPVLSGCNEYGFMASIVKPYNTDTLREALDKVISRPAE